MFQPHSPTRVIGLAALAVAATALGSAPAKADSSTGTIGVSLNVNASCMVNGAAMASSLGQIGSIAFTDQSGIFGDTSAQLVATGGGNAISVLCSPGLTPSLTIGTGAHDDSGVHRMASGSNMLPYHLYSDAGATDEITINQQISLGTATTTAFSVPLYAHVNSGGVILPAGSYTDTIQVTLNW
ncbi:MAG: Csu type fimbrial protein [Sphingomonas oligoaromativorans]|jgi:spore coat protein U-like protein|uniref:Csu type fimbrial protein n=1 Tax=Sphingomonas oligoaromativorans TaxID=575322 RepID=UPI001420258D|nr:spore coat U domain-containing protein [Sphingomonas oligoaromativorans]NIJ33140.1 spore coat protein U-like protein [Sphingomonas oligoaromativorans]